MSTTNDSLIDKKLHSKYFLRFLGLLPPSQIHHDSSRTSIVYFCLASLDLLGTLESMTTLEQRKTWADWIYSNLTENGDGFRGSPTHAILQHPGTEKCTGSNSQGTLDTNETRLSGVVYPKDGSDKLNLKGIQSYDPADLSSTFFCLHALAILRDERLPQYIDRNKLAAYVSQCQRKRQGDTNPVPVYYADSNTIGSFAPNFSQLTSEPFGENDPRCNFTATSILHILHKLPTFEHNRSVNEKDSQTKEEGPIDVDAAVSFILSTQSYEGGFGGYPGTEAHSGYTYCGLSSLKIILDAIKDSNKKQSVLKQLEHGADWQQVMHWVTHREIWPTESISAKGLDEVKRHEKESNEEELEKADGMHWRFDEQGGFNGRTNKQADTCYSFWSTASLLVLNELVGSFGSAKSLRFGSDIPFNTRHAQMYLLNETQETQTGGFSREKGHRADPYHSFLALTALSLFDEADLKSKTISESRYGLKTVIPHMCASTDSIDWIRNELTW